MDMRTADESRMDWDDLVKAIAAAKRETVEIVKRERPELAEEAEAAFKTNTPSDFLNKHFPLGVGPNHDGWAIQSALIAPRLLQETIDKTKSPPTPIKEQAGQVSQGE